MGGYYFALNRDASHAQITQETLLDFESFKKEPAENDRQFYERLLQHARLHLAPAGAKAENITNVKADTLTISLMNLVALQWLRKRDPQLIAIVRTEYATELRSGEQLSALVPRIAPNIESLLARHSAGQVHRVEQEIMEDEPVVKAVRQYNFLLWGGNRPPLYFFDKMHTTIH